MVDCRWKEGSGFMVQGSEAVESTEYGVRSAEKGIATTNLKSGIPNPKSSVSLGDKFALASGLMEITYDTGARVILQGPVTYEVESATGGYLSLGKLTARVEN
jgi:hypothetical protein